MACVRAILVAVALAVPASAFCQVASPSPRPVIVQGAMQMEIELFANRLGSVSVERIGGWTFWRGTLDGYPVILSKTLKGVSNTAAATAIAAERFHPIAIINQGTAGGHDPTLHVYDIVVGTSSVNLGAFKTAERGKGQGSNSLEWKPLDLMVTEGSAGEVWNSELDRILRFRTQFGTLVEEMETASAAQIAGLYRIPFLGIRVLSNNITNRDPYDPKTGEACQAYVYEVVKAYIGGLKR